MNWYDDVEREDRSTGARDEDARWIAVNERGWSALETRAAHEQSGGHLQADPPELEHVDGEPRFAADGVAVDAQIVVHARERGVHRRGQGIRCGRKRARAERAIFVEREYYPAVGSWWFLR